MLFFKNLFYQLSDVSLSERVGTDAPVRITSGDFAKRLTAKGIRFSMRNGVVKKLKPSEESKEADVLNIQRGKGDVLNIQRGKAVFHQSRFSKVGGWRGKGVFHQSFYCPCSLTTTR